MFLHDDLQDAATMKVVGRGVKLIRNQREANRQAIPHQSLTADN
jgi:hypothetical protein